VGGKGSGGQAGDDEAMVYDEGRRSESGTREGDADSSEESRQPSSLMGSEQLYFQRRWARKRRRAKLRHHVVLGGTKARYRLPGHEEQVSNDYAVRGYSANSSRDIILIYTYFGLNLPY
jgi:hypothetical protein